jgi:hypothetical protein
MSANNVSILVQNTDKCILLAKFIDDNITRLNKAGLFIRMVKLYPENIKRLRAKGITRLPVLIDMKRRPHIGTEKIMHMLRKGLPRPGAPVKDYDGPRVETPPITGENAYHLDEIEVSRTADIDNYWQDTIYHGYNPKTKQFSQSERGEEDPSENLDFDRKMQNFQKKRPGERTPGVKYDFGIEEEDVSQQQQRRNRGGKSGANDAADQRTSRARDRGVSIDDSPEETRDNIDIHASYDNVRDSGEDPNDAKMFEAMLNNMH